MTASQSAIEVDAAAPVGLGFGISGLGGQSHSVATIEDVTASPTSFSIGGYHSVASIDDTSTSQNGIALNGKYSGAQIVGNNFTLFPNGTVTSAGYNTLSGGQTVTGVTCSAGTTSAFAVTNGIVTHC